MSRSRNVGAQQATTEYIAFLDDDDFWLPEYLEHTLKLFAEDPEVGAVVGALHYCGTNGVQRPYKRFPPTREAQRGVYYRNPGIGGNLAIKRKLFIMLGGFDPSLPASVDRDLAARMLQVDAKIACSPTSIAVRCDHEGDRVRGSQVRANRLFIVKHWRHMRWPERYKACRTFILRWWLYKVMGHIPR